MGYRSREDRRVRTLYLRAKDTQQVTEDDEEQVVAGAEWHHVVVAVVLESGSQVVRGDRSRAERVALHHHHQVVRVGMVFAGLLGTSAGTERAGLLGLDDGVLYGLRKSHMSRSRRGLASTVEFGVDLVAAVVITADVQVQVQVQVQVHCVRHSGAVVLALELRWESTGHLELSVRNEDRVAAFDSSHEDHIVLVQPAHLDLEQESTRLGLGHCHIVARGCGWLDDLDLRLEGLGPEMESRVVVVAVVDPLVVALANLYMSEQQGASEVRVVFGCYLVIENRRFLYLVS